MEDFEPKERNETAIRSQIAKELAVVARQHIQNRDGIDATAARIILEDVIFVGAGTGKRWQDFESGREIPSWSLLYRLGNFLAKEKVQNSFIGFLMWAKYQPAINAAKQASRGEAVHLKMPEIDIFSSGSKD